MVAEMRFYGGMHPISWKDYMSNEELAKTGRKVIYFQQSDSGSCSSLGQSLQKVGHRS